MRNKTLTKFEFDTAKYQQFYGTLFINNREVPASDIYSFTVREWILPNLFLPRLELVLIDGGRLSELELPIHDTQIKLMISKHEESAEAEDLLFNILDFEILNGQNPNDQRIIKISAYLDIPNLFSIESKSYDGTSLDVFKQIAKELKLKYNKVNNISAQDKMIYYKLKQNNITFFKHILEKSYIGKDDVLFAYITTDNLLNTLSLKDAYSKKPVYKLRYDIELATANSKDNFKQLLKDKRIKEDDKSIYYSNYGIINKSGTFFNNGGYSVLSSNYNLEDNEYFETEVNSSESFFNTDLNSFKDFASNTKYIYNGLNIKTNVYSDYEIAASVRHNILNSFFANSIEIEIDSYSNPNIGDMIDLIIPSKSQTTAKLNNEPLSGKYIIISKLRTASKLSIFKKRIIVARLGTNEGIY